MNHALGGALTHVEMTWVEKRIEHWLLFGRMVECHPLDRYRRLLGFAPDSVFGIVRWTSGVEGTVTFRVDIMRAPCIGEPRTALPFVRCGADRLLGQTGWDQVRRVLAEINRIEARGCCPCDIDPENWRRLHARMEADQTLAAGASTRSLRQVRAL